jgi:hypothetical protein
VPGQAAKGVQLCGRHLQGLRFLPHGLAQHVHDQHREAGQVGVLLGLVVLLELVRRLVLGQLRIVLVGLFELLRFLWFVVERVERREGRLGLTRPAAGSSDRSVAARSRPCGRSLPRGCRFGRLI